MDDKYNVPIKDKVLLTIPEAAAYTNIGQNRIAELLRRYDCNFVLCVGNKKLVKREAFEEYIAQTVNLP